jgi:hypothetical protein
MSNDQRWQDMTPDEQAVAIRQISGAVNGLQFRVQDLEDAVKVLQERLDKRGDLPLLTQATGAPIGAEPSLLASEKDAVQHERADQRQYAPSTRFRSAISM